MTAAPVAVGENVAAPIPAMIRLKSASPNVGAITVPTFARTKTAPPQSNKRLRGMAAANAAIGGDNSANVME